MTGSESPLSLKMQAVRGIFESTRQQAFDTADLTSLSGFLSGVQPEFRTVAYEAASMGLYQRDLKKQNGQVLWPVFLEQANSAYVPDIYTGLGCAMAQEDLHIHPFIDLFDLPMHYRILDGYGFYKGLFRARQTLQQQAIPQDINGLYVSYYDQGLGRSLWYVTGGDADKIKAAIDKFDAARRAELWRGTGIACSYLGGCDEAALYHVLGSAGGYSPQLLAGAAVSAKARIDSHTSGEDMELACRLWCNRQAAECAELAAGAQGQANGGSEKAYAAWMALLDKQFKPAGVTKP